MKYLRVWQKLALLGGVFLIPLCAVTFTLIASIDAAGVDSARHEVSGLQLAPPVLQLIRDLELHRDAQIVVLEGDRSFESRLDTVRARIATDLDAVEAAERRLDASLHGMGHWSRLRAAVRENVDAPPAA